MITRPRGTSDILPGEVERWQYVEGEIRSLCRLFNFREIRTPVFEHTELFLRGVGEGTDIVEKEMYTFTDRGGRSLTLRPEGTASVVRAYLEHKLYAEGGAAKFYYLAPMFRYERPQAGRLRQHHQFGVEIFGASSAAADAEVISLAMALLQRLGLAELTVHLNSIGCSGCRPAYRRELQDYFRPHLAALCPDCQRRFERNPLRLLDCKEEGCRRVREGAPQILQHLCLECREHFQSLQDQLERLGIPFRLDPWIVRGLDYYTRTVFEVLGAHLGAQSTVCAGGRYDGLIESMGGPPVPGVGFGLGLERLLLLLEKGGHLNLAPPGPLIFVAAADPAGGRAALTLTQELRRAGLMCELDLTGRSLKSQLKQADRLGATWAVLLGEKELAEGAATVRDMETGREERLPLSELALRLNARVKERNEEDASTTN